MVALAVVGAVVITAALIFYTWYIYGLLFMQFAFAGLESLDKKDWLFISAAALVNAFCWVVWWFLVGTHIHIGVS